MATEKEIVSFICGALIVIIVWLCNNVRRQLIQQSKRKEK